MAANGGEGGLWRMTVVKLHNRNLLLRWVSCPLLLACLPEKESKWIEYGPHFDVPPQLHLREGSWFNGERMVIDTDGGDENSKDGEERRRDKF